MLVKKQRKNCILTDVNCGCYDAICNKAVICNNLKTAVVCSKNECNL